MLSTALPPLGSCGPGPRKEKREGMWIAVAAVWVPRDGVACSRWLERPGQGLGIGCLGCFRYISFARRERKKERARAEQREKEMHRRRERGSASGPQRPRGGSVLAREEALLANSEWRGGLGRRRSGPRCGPAERRRGRERMVAVTASAPATALEVAGVTGGTRGQQGPYPPSCSHVNGVS